MGQDVRSVRIAGRNVAALIMRTNDPSRKLTSRLHLLPLCLVIPMMVYLAISAWYDVSQFTVFAGDDLRSFPAAQRGFAGFNEMMISYYKFRPVTALLFGAVAHWTNCEFKAVASVGLMLHTLNAFLFFYLLAVRLRLPVILSVGVCAIAIFNRFATYVFMLDPALTHGLAIAVFLLILIVSSSFIERPGSRDAVWLVLLYAIILHTYEQYLVLALPLVLLGIATFRSHRTSAIILSAGVLLSAMANFWIKSFLLRTPILTGTTTQPITFDLPQIISFFWHGALNLAGINSGPAHLSLEDFHDSVWWIQLVSVAAVLLSGYIVFGIVAGVTARLRLEKARSALIPLAFYCCTAAVMLLSASITFRQQYSWLYPAYLSFLAFLAFGWQAMKARRWGFSLALTCLVLFSIPREFYLARRHGQFFAFQTVQTANNLYKTLNSVDGTASTDVVVIRGDVPAEEWVFLNGAFSRWYRLPPLEFVKLDAPLEQTDQSRLVVNYNGNDRAFRVARDSQVASTTSTHQMNFAVLKPSAAAMIPSDQWSTPSKTPMFQMSKNGVDCMIEVSPVEVVVPVPPPATVLHVSFSHVYAIGDGVDLEIAAATETGSVMLLSRRVPPLTDNDAPVWRKYEFALPRDTRNVQVRVFSKSDPGADWLAIRDFSFQ